MADETLDEISTLDLSKLKVPDLKKELKNRGFSTSGNKNELVERLRTAIKSNDPQMVDCIDDEEDLLNDDDDEHIDERESLINDLDNDLEDLPRAQKRKSDVETKSESTSGPPKKVILKRNTSETIATKSDASKPDEKLSGEKKVDETTNTGSGEEKKVIKLSELSVKERLEMRAKKFGVTALNDDVKKIARAERFGATAPKKSDDNIKSEDNASIDVLKQRAARFGISVSSVMSDLEKKEKLEKRKERFGLTAKTNGTSSSDSDASKAARLERFKMTVK